MNIKPSNMNIKIYFFLLIMIGVVPFYTFSQMGGNHLYQNETMTYNRQPVRTTSISTTDSSLIVTSTVLMSQEADSYVLSVSVSQFDKTVKGANRKSDARIQNLMGKMSGLGIKKKDVSVDFISETKVYEQTLDGNTITEHHEGFTIRRNIIIKVKELEKIDKIIDYCAEEEIYDIVKVDYISKDLEKINENLLAQAIDIAENKKKVYEKNSSIQLTGKHRLASETFDVYYPKKMYKQYNEAHETAAVETYYSSSYTTKKVRKEKTMYYDGIEGDIGVNRITDEVSPRVGIQYVVKVVFIYELEK